jgi:pimeloyl-ACP methyl ester carboxylesterase
MDALIDDLADVVAQLRERPVMVGASMGGMTALMGEGERGNLARGLVLVDVTPTLDRQATERIRTFMTAHPNGFPSLEAAAVAVQDYRPGRTRPANPDGLRKNLRQRSDGRWYWHWDPAFLLDGNEPRRRMSSARSRAAARALTVPTLLVRGAESDVVTTTTADELLQLATHAQYVDVPGAGHMVAGDDNEIFADHVVRFLGTVSAATGQRNTESEHPTQLLTPSGRRRRRSAG